ncbi:MAG: tRNA (N(6)-L-threonylcarbamoyladenosine(37)-C(2))-methylthiotransferase [Methanobrevibacter sp.]|jgi:MiaB-like tRNA modifying enzyme|nr:tRNA (N(6)-L-threonylcarbamoyladenosine(37)-C(2))-methylthiotransferase [Candidatus Methanoflexus mossambicus]
MNNLKDNVIESNSYKPKVFIETFGCTFNKADSEIIAGNLIENGIVLVDKIDNADVAIVNTCYVKNPTESKVTTRIHKLQKEFPELKIVVSGCMVEIDPEKLNKIAPNSSWIGPHKLNTATEVVNATINGNILRKSGFTKDSKVGLVKKSFDKHIHIIQICEGCLGACTYCCTRFARGPLNSYPIEDIVTEAKEAINNGAVEIQLTAQDTAAFGKDTGEKLSTLITKIATLDGEFRVRIGMMHPKNLGDDLNDVINGYKHDKIYKFIHLPIQTGSNKVLKEMKRGHTVEEYYDIVKQFKIAIPEITLATDIIVGYPTENNDDFKDTVNFLKDLKPNIIHLSKYKHRKGASSSNLDEIPYDLMKKRSKYLSEIKTAITKNENNELIGKTVKAIVIEKGKKSGYLAKTDNYLPLILEDAEIGKFVNVKITEVTGTYLKGKII